MTFSLQHLPGLSGRYSASITSGTMAAGLAADAEVVQFRWTHATRLCVPLLIRIDGLGSIAGFTAGVGKVDLMLARSWSADGSGGAALTLTGNNQKLRTAHGTTGVGAIRGSTTAALTAGTKTLDAHPIGSIPFSVPTTTNFQIVTGFPLFDARDRGTAPLALALNEGFVLRATVPATGTWMFGVTVEWAEIDQ